jgi:hypothetical protein
MKHIEVIQDFVELQRPKIEAGEITKHEAAVLLNEYMMSEEFLDKFDVEELKELAALITPRK